jgi:cephalosporin-C deacetylase-like acetyl esterase
MLSRRKFLQTNMAGLTLPLVNSQALAQTVPATARLDESSARAYWNDWPNYLTAKVNESRARRKAALAALSSAAQVRERAQMVRAKVWDLIGGPLERTPLNPTVVGSMERQTYRIEKVIFESQPQVYVTANLYVPTAGSGPFPGILGPLGHSQNGKAYWNYQYLFQTLARKGYVVLAFDPFGQGERHQYLDPRTGRPIQSPTGEHSEAGRPLLLLGETFAQYRVWDGIRALDYLLSRPEVDSERIGCTGQSGGGTMTMYLCALDPRIHAAVESEGNSENLAGPDYDPPGAIADAEQNLVGSLPFGIDRGDLLMAFAPNPLLICYTLQDAGTTYSPLYVKGTQEVFEELKTVYRLMGLEEKVQLFTSYLPHGFDFFTRRATYDWFNSWLAKKDLGDEEAEFDPSPPVALNCTSTGEVLTSLGGRSVVQISSDRARILAAPSTLLHTSGGPQALRQNIRQQLRDLLALPSERGALRPRLLSARTGQGVTTEEFEFWSEPHVRVPGWFLKPPATRTPVPTILYVSEHGKDRIAHDPREVDTFVKRGYAVCAIDLRGLGKTAPRYPKAGPLFYGYHDPDIQDGYAWACLILGKPVFGQRVWDFLRCLDYLEARPDVDRNRIRVVGLEGGGLAALLGAALDDRPRAIFLYQTLATFRSIVEAQEYSMKLPWFVFGFLRHFDLPDLVGSLAPRPCWLMNTAGAQGERLPESVLRERFSAALDYYVKNGGEGKLRFLVQGDEQRALATASWLESS